MFRIACPLQEPRLRKPLLYPAELRKPRGRVVAQERSGVHPSRRMKAEMAKEIAVLDEPTTAWSCSRGMLVIGT